MFRRWGLVAAGTSALALLIASPAAGHPPAATARPIATPTFTQVNQVSNQDGKAQLPDPDLVNAWGLASSATSPLWVANNGTNTATLYRGGVAGAAVTKVGLTVSIDGGAPTGQVFNDTPDFTLPTATGPVPATFIFDSEDGDITAWNSTATGTTAVVKAHVDGAVFKGLAIWHTRLGNFLLAADFAGGLVRVFDSKFNEVTLPAPFFRDRHLPPGYAPFNVMTDGETVYVTYAKQVPGSDDEAHGQGLGIVDQFTDLGVTAKRIASHGPLNAPWGMAFAPDAWGTLAGSLLVGNFGDGRIDVYRDGHFAGQLRDATGMPITIDGLWALRPGTANTGGVDAVWFSAGPDDEANGLVGELYPSG
jgi:uncharacterized protein (TIGR03118 family)